MRIILIISILVGLSGFTYGDFENNLNSSCKILARHQRGMASGSGTVINEDNDYYYVLTNGHVAANCNNVSVSFFHEDTLLDNVPARIAWQGYIPNTTADTCLLAVEKTKLDIVPVIIHLAPEGTKINKGDIVAGAGYPQGYWCQAWRSRVIKNNGGSIYYEMPPVEGQSGSGITKIIDGKEYLIGINTWRYEDENGRYGGAVSLETIYSLFNQTYRVQKTSTNHITISLECKNCLKPEEEHYWVHNEDGTVNTNLYCQPKRCPRCGGFHQAPNMPSPESPNQDGVQGKLPDIFRNPPVEPDKPIPDEPAPAPPEDNTALIQSLREKIRILSEEISSLKQKNEELNTKNIELLKTIDSSVDKSELESIKNDRDELNIKISELEKEKQVISNKVSDLENKNLSLKKESTELLSVNQNLSITINEYKNQINNLENNITQIRNELNNIKNQQADVPVVTPPKQEKISIVERFKNWVRPLLKDFLLAKLGIFGTLLVTGGLGAVGGYFLKKILVVKFGQKKAGIIYWILSKAVKFLEKKKHPEYNNMEPEEPKEVIKEPDCPKELECPPKTPKYSGEIVANSRFRDLLDLKEKQGQKLEHLAALGRLYKEAVNYLRTGVLRNISGQKIFGARSAADAIELYVKTHMAEEISAESFLTLEKEELVTQALYGFLYQEAVKILRDGRFENLINEEDIANAIENHVNSRILEYVQGTGKQI